MEFDLPEILEGCKKGLPLMQKQLYEYCYGEMMKVCFRYTHDTDKAAIVYNDAMLKVFRTVNNYKEQGRLMVWVKRIVVNTAIDYIRVKSNFLPGIGDNVIEEEEYNIDSTVFEKMTAKEIHQLINSLPEKLAIVFNLYVYEEYDHKEIGELLNMPVGTSRYYLSEARKKLKEIISNPIFSLNKAI